MNIARVPRSILILIVIAMVLSTVFTAVPYTIFAETVKNDFDKSDILTDLKDLTINGKAFNVNDYPFSKNGKPELLTFVEYCYSDDKDKQDNFALYLYIYNPEGIKISTDSKSNKVQMAISFDDKGNPTDFAKFDLIFSNRTDGAYKNLFYKFRIKDKSTQGKTILEIQNAINRRYYISGIELKEYGKDNAEECPVNKAFRYSGYAKGYSEDSESKSTLKCEVTSFESISLNVNHTFYRTKTSGKGAYYQNQLDTVYFTVPERYFDTYGTLQRIKAEWYEYKTKDIVVTSNNEFYTKALPYIGKQTGEFDKFGMTVYNKDIFYSLGQNAGDSGGGIMVAQWGWNLGSGYLHVPAPALFYLFKVNNIDSYDPYADIVSTGGVTSNALYKYIKEYDKTFNNGTLPVKEGTISADLFADDIDDYRKADTEYGKIQNGYSYYDFNADIDIQKLTSWQEGNPSFWDNWLNWGLWDTIFGNIPSEESRTVPPIYILKESDLTGSDEQIAERLLVNANDVGRIKKCYNDALTVNPLDKSDEKQRVVLFRFATSDYYSAPVDIIEPRTLLPDKHIKGQAYRAFESVFLDFDVIQLSFKNDDTYTVLAAISNPIDAVNDITSPIRMPNETEWWKILLAFILFVILLVILYPLISFVIRILLYTISLPFKVIMKLIRRHKRE